MKKYALFLILFLLSACNTPQSNLPPPKDVHPSLPKAKVDAIYMFGDSLSDTGNFFLLVDQLVDSNNIRLKSPPASQGGRKFSNRYLLIEYIASHYEVPLATAWEVSPSAKEIIKSLPQNSTHGISRHLFSYATNTQIPSKYHNTLSRLSQNYGTKSKGNNYAVSGASVGSYNSTVDKFLSQFTLEKQIDLHSSVDEATRSSDISLHIVVIGGNDVIAITREVDDLKEQERLIDAASRNYIAQIVRLRKMGAKNIIASTAPELGLTPAFYHLPTRDRASYLSKRLEKTVRRQIKQRFKSSEVSHVSLTEILNKTQMHWPAEKLHQKCVSDILNGYFDPIAFIFNSGEFSIKFVNGCNQKRLDNGNFRFFDELHATDEQYRLAVPYYIQAINYVMDN